MKNQAQRVYLSSRQALMPGSQSPVETSTDQELIALLQARDLGWKLAFNELLGRHRAWLVDHCAMRLGSRSDAQDVTQLVLIRAWRSLDRFEGRSAFRTWLYSIAENQCRTYMKQRLRYIQTEHIERLIDLNLESGFSSNTDDNALSEAVSVTLERLGETAREVMVLRFYRGCSLEEIAGALSISLSAAKMRLYRALEQFKAKYIETGTVC